MHINYEHYQLNSNHTLDLFWNSMGFSLGIYKTKKKA
jgi:hypothetical protein